MRATGLHLLIFLSCFSNCARNIAKDLHARNHVPITTPNGTTPNGTTPNGTTPNGTTPNGTTTGIKLADKLNRLTNFEYKATLQRALPKMTVNEIGLDLSSEVAEEGFRQGGTVSSGQIKKYFQAAQTVAKYLASNSNNLPCSKNSKECFNQIINFLVPKLWRLPVSQDDTKKILRLVDQTPESDKITVILMSLLLSPKFLLHHENLSLYDQDPQKQMERFSYRLFSAPNPSSMDLDSKQLKDPDYIRQVLKDSRDEVIAKLEQFFFDFLGTLDYQAMMQKTSTNKFTFDERIGDQLYKSVKKQLIEDFYDGKVNYHQLLTSKQFYVNKAIAPLFGLEQGTSESLAYVQVSNRTGIYSHPFFMAFTSDPDKANIISRGLFFTLRVLGLNIPAPQVNNSLPPRDKGDKQSEREIVEALTKDPSCQVCHMDINPPGFSSHRFDHIGRFRSREFGQPIDESGKINRVDIAFSNFDEMMTRLADSRQINQNFVEKLYRFYIGRPPANLKDLTEDFIAKPSDSRPQGMDYQLKDLIIRILLDA